MGILDKLKTLSEEDLQKVYRESKKEVCFPLDKDVEGYILCEFSGCTQRAVHLVQPPEEFGTYCCYEHTEFFVNDNGDASVSCIG